MTIDFTQVEIKNLITHHIGNKLRDEKVELSIMESIIDSDTKNLLLRYFLSSFRMEEWFSFYHPLKIEMNEVYSIVNELFSNPSAFIKSSQSLSKLLYEQSVHPKIKEGELNIVYFSKVIFKDEIVDAIGIFKSEKDIPFIQMRNNKTNFSINHEFGFELTSMDKGCIILNTEKEDGYRVAIIDKLNKSIEAQYWKDNFLKVSPINDEYHHTNQFLGITKQFVTKQLITDFNISKADQIALLNQSVDYFKSHESFDREEFEEKVFSDSNMIQSFRQFDDNYRKDNDIELANKFEISSQAVTKQSRIFKRVLKLDRNFHIYIHGNKDLIEQGIDEKGRKYYKIYYEEES
jgi:hypothetical protein